MNPTSCCTSTATRRASATRCPPPWSPSSTSSTCARRWRRCCPSSIAGTWPSSPTGRISWASSRASTCSTGCAGASSKPASSGRFVRLAQFPSTSGRNRMKDEGARHYGQGTLAIHAGQSPDPSTGAVMPPIYATSTYAQSSPGVHQGFEYSRSHNPTRFAYERCVAGLESGTQGYAFASGLAATATVLDVLDSDSHVVCMDDVYGGTYRLFERVRRRSAGLDFSFVDLNDMAAVEAAVTAKTKLIWCETPTNPLLKIVDIPRLAEFARKRGIRLAVDNTFSSPILQRPLELGAHLVMHSATKYLNGHSDMVGGMLVVGDDAELAEQ